MLVRSFFKELFEVLQNTILFVEVLREVLLIVLLLQCLIDTSDLVLGVVKYAFIVENDACGLVR